MKTLLPSARTVAFALTSVVVTALGVACAAPVDDGTAPDESVGATAAAQKIVYSPELPDATCEKNILGNMICSVCTTGPFPSCKDYVCDANGQNCKATVRVIRPTLPVGTISNTNVYAP